MSAVVDFPVKPETRPYLDAFGRARRRGGAGLARGLPHAQPRPLRRAGLSDPAQRSLALSRSAPARADGRCFRPAREPRCHSRDARAARRNRAWPKRRIGSCWSTARFAPELSRLERTSAGVWLGSTAAAIAERPDLVRAGARDATSLDRSRSPRSTPRFSPMALSSMSRPASRSSGRSRSFICPMTTPAARCTRAASWSPVAGSRATLVETFAGVGSYWRNDVVELRLGAGAELARVTLVEEAADALHFGETLRDARRSLAARQLCPVAGRPDGAARSDGAQRRRGGALRAQRRLSAVGPSRGQHRHHGRSHGAGRRDPRSLQGGRRRPRAWRLSGPDHGSARRAEDRRASAQPQSAARPRARRSTPSPSSKSRRRRQMQPRRRGRRSRRSGAVLSARPRHPERRGAADADRGFRRGRRSSWSSRRRCASTCTRGSSGAWRRWRSKNDDGEFERPQSPPRQRPSGRVGFDPRLLRREFPIFANNPGLVFLDSGASAQKPRSVIDRRRRLLPHRLRQCASRRLSAERALDRAVRGGAREDAARFSTPPTRARSSSCAAPPRDQPRRAELGRGLPQSRRRGADQRARASFQHRAVAAAARPHRHPAGRGADRCDRRARPGRLRGAAVAAHQAGRDHPPRQCHRRARAGRDRSSRLAHRHGAKVLVDGCQAAPRLPVDVQALDCDFYAFSGHKTYGPTGIGVLYGSYELLVGDAALAGRRRHDPQRHLREDRVPGAAAPLRGRHARHFRRDRARHGARFHRGARPRRDPRARGGADRLRRRPAVAHPGSAAGRRRASGGSASCPSTSTACIRTTSRTCSISTRSPCAPGIIARSR